MRVTGRIASSEPNALALRTARHFAHKVPVDEVDGVQRIETRFGRIELEPGDGELIVTLDGADVGQLRTVAESHLERFARGAPFEPRWED
jgi:hypothetical protein